jgi:hypothetical protein
MRNRNGRIAICRCRPLAESPGEFLGCWQSQIGRCEMIMESGGMPRTFDTTAPRPPARTMIIALSAILVLAGCVPAARPQPPQVTPSPASASPTEPDPPPAPTTYRGSEEPPLELTELWQSAGQPIADLSSADVIKNSLVTTGWGKARSDEESVVIDSRHGTVRWRASQLPREFALDSDGRPRARLSDVAGWAVERTNEGMLILPYQLGPCQDGGHECPARELKPYREQGLVGFSLTDRSQVWHTDPIRSAAPRADRPPTSGFQSLEVVGATSSTVLVTIGVAGNYFADLEWDSPERRPRTIAYDSATGSNRWQLDGFVAEAMFAGDVVLGRERSSRPGATGGVPVRVDAVLGKRRWSMSAETSVKWSSIGDSGAIATEVGSSDPDSPAARQFWVPSYDVDPQPLPPASPDASDWIAPAIGGPRAWRVVSGSSPDGSPKGPQLQCVDISGEFVAARTPLPDDAIAAQLGWADYVWVGTASGKVRAFDPTGKPRSPKLTGTVRLVEVDLLLVTRPGSTLLRLLEINATARTPITGVIGCDDLK